MSYIGMCCILYFTSKSDSMVLHYLTFPVLIITPMLFEFPDNSRSSNITSWTEFQSFTWCSALFEQLTNQNSEWSAYVHFLWLDCVSLISSNSFNAAQTAAYATWWQASVYTRTGQDRAAPINTCHIQNRKYLLLAKNYSDQKRTKDWKERIVQLSQLCWQHPLYLHHCSYGQKQRNNLCVIS